MKLRRHVWLGLGLMLPLIGLFAWMRAAASWRPQAVGALYSGNTSNDVPVFLFASDDLVLSPDNIGTLFDLNTGAHDPVTSSGVVGLTGKWIWEVQFQKSSRLSLRDVQGESSSYKLPPLDAGEITVPSVADARVQPDFNRVALVTQGRYCQWNLSSRRLERTVKIYFCDSGPTALSRDGETLVNAGWKGISWASTRSGDVVREVPLSGFQAFETQHLSRYGSFALYDGVGTKGPSTRWNVVGTNTGKALWHFDTDCYKAEAVMSPAVMSPDEKLIFLPLFSRRIWQVRELKTGKVLRTLPLLLGVQVAASSPDGATLYSVAGGVLYRQRAR